MTRLKAMNNSSIGRLILATLLMAVLATACNSRYRLSLFLVEGDQRTRVKVEKTEYMLGVVLGDPMSREKVEPGDGNMLVLLTGSRGETVNDDNPNLMKFDRHVRYRLFVQMDTVLSTGSTALKNNSLVQMMGRYEMDALDKLFYPTAGEMVVDSISGNKLFGNIDGRFENHKGTAVAFVGRFKAKVSD